ncbi:MAG: DMT family transporter [Burkholderiales bacterium]|nr:DMT family transporter [Burkholderiales bacterium]
MMVFCAFLWSTAGVAMRAASVTNGWEATFWRSLFLCGVVGAYLLARHRGRAPARLRAMGWHGAVSGVCWATMFTAFMLALSLTTVANTLATMATMPFFAALAGRLLLGERIAPRTWAAMAAAAVGIAAMFHEAFASGTIAGSVVALAVPLAAAANTVTVKLARGQVDLVPALLVGGAISVALAAPFALPLSADARDLAIFAALADLSARAALRASRRRGDAAALGRGDRPAVPTRSGARAALGLARLARAPGGGGARRRRRRHRGARGKRGGRPLARAARGGGCAQPRFLAIAFAIAVKRPVLLGRR